MTHNNYQQIAAKIDTFGDSMDSNKYSFNGAFETADKRGPEKKIILINAADLKPEPIDWLWEEWIAQGKLHVLAGVPGEGKTSIAMSMAATVSSGGRWPDGTTCEPGNVLIWSGEDDPANTLLPRLLASGGEVTRCNFISGKSVSGQVQSFDPAKDMSALEAKAEEIGGVKLLILDPLVSAIIGNGNNNAEVRKSLQPLVDFASRTNAAILGITHLSKGSIGADPATRVIGSVAFTAVARVVFLAAKVTNEDGEETRILVRAKSNIGPDDGGFSYQVPIIELSPGIRTCRIDWGKNIEGSAAKLLRDSSSSNLGRDHKTSSLQEAKDFLFKLLSDEPIPSNEVEKLAQQKGISLSTLRRASKALEVKKSRSKDCWYSSLPDF